jgi:cytochrome c biogenesis protein CcmG, thiol:disulfide interchange protein DsbE
MKFSKESGQHKSFWTPLRSALTLTMFALLATIIGSSCSKSADSPEGGAPKATVTVNGGAKPANAPKTINAPVGPTSIPASALEAPLKTMEGKSFKLADLKGKVLVIDLWATWCGPCRSSTPELVNLQKEYGPKGLEVIGLDIDPKSDSPEDVKEFADEFDINYKLAFADQELAMSLMRGGSIPQSLVVARDGRILEHLVGYSPTSTPKRLRAAIEQALQ